MEKHTHTLEWKETLEGGSYWACTFQGCDKMEFQYEDCPGGR